MSEEADFEKTKELLLNINGIVAQMDPAVRVATFEMLTARYITKKVVPAKTVDPKHNGADEDQVIPDTKDLGVFISSFDTSKPSEALHILIAWLYSQRGAQAFSTAELKDLADQCGLTIPNRPDMTLKGAKTNGKSIYAQAGRNWKLTVSGELHVKSTYNVTKGSVTASPED